MNYFPLLVQEIEVKIPAPVCEVVAHAATAWTLPPVVLHGKFDSQSRCSASFTLLSHPSYSVPQSYASTCGQHQRLPPSSPRKSGSLYSVSTPKGEHQIGLASEREPDIIKESVAPIGLCDCA